MKKNTLAESLVIDVLLLVTENVLLEHKVIVHSQWNEDALQHQWWVHAPVKVNPSRDHRRHHSLVGALPHQLALILVVSCFPRGSFAGGGASQPRGCRKRHENLGFVFFPFMITRRLMMNTAVLHMQIQNCCPL